jgi:hypothetical protein
MPGIRQLFEQNRAWAAETEARESGLTRDLQMSVGGPDETKAAVQMALGALKFTRLGRKLTKLLRRRLFARR